MTHKKSERDMTVHKDLCEMTTWAEVRDHYHQMFPLIREHDRLIDQFNTRASINEDLPPGALDTMEVARRALIAVGKPPRDEDDVRHAERWLNAINYEMRSVLDQSPPSLADEVIETEISYAGAVMPAEACESMSHDRLVEHAEMLASGCSEGLLRSHLAEALVIALPTIYRRITADDRRARLRAVGE